MTAMCPHCHKLHEVGHYVSGDRVWCTRTDGWFVVQFAAGGARLTACAPPAYFLKSLESERSNE